MSSTTGNFATARRSKGVQRGDLDFLGGGGEMGERTRTMDWASTPVGPVAFWPASLKAAVSICLGSRHPMVLWWGRQAYTQFYNDAYISFLGSKHPDCLGQSGRDCWSEIWPVIGPMLEGVYATGEATWSEDLLLVLDRHLPREEAYFTFSYSPIRDEDGAVAGIFCACNETTARVLSERRLKALRDLNRVVADGKTAETACEAAGRILRDNPGDVAFALIYLLDGSAEQARLVVAAGVEEDGAAAPARIDLKDISAHPPVWPLARVFETGVAQLVPDAAERFGLLPGGLWQEPSETALIAPIGAPGQASPTGFLISGLSPRRVFDDDYKSFFDLLAGHLGTAIANARAYEEERRRSQMLAALDRAKTIFFSNVSHEFRTPLTLMLGPVEEAAANPATPAAVRTQLKLAQRNALRLLKLVNSLLDFSRIEAGRVQASYEPTDLAAVTRDLASTFHSAMERAGLIYNVECHDIGEPVYIDREMWEKIVLNLVSNAFKYTFQGTIAVRTRRDASHAALEVSDTGVGIPEHELPHLFERFHRVERTAGRTQEGSGIGLALVQELVKFHGGAISATSELGCGTTFCVRIPFGTAHLPADRIKAPRSLGSTAIGAQAFVQEALHWMPRSVDETLQDLIETQTPPRDQRFAHTAGARLLLADDNGDMRAYLRDLLSPLYTIEAVADGEQALAAARRERPDLIVSDIMMPRIDGLALLNALRADEHLRDVPVILLSARAGEEARLEGLDAGADDYLVKPFSARELLARVGALLERTRMRSESAGVAAHLAAIVSSSDDAIVSKTLEGTIQSWNAGAERIFGWSAAEVIGRSITLIMPPNLLAEEQHILETLKRGERIDHFETTRIAKDGRRVEVSLTVSPVLDATGRVTGASKIARDITARKRTERLLREREQALEEADRRKDEFLAMLAHELRNPLAPLANASELLTRALADDQVDSAVGIVKRQITQLTRLVDDLLDVSRITQGRIQLKQRPLDLATVITQAVETVEPQLRTKRHKLSITASSYEHLYVHGDFARLVQCLGNILTNAIKYTEPGGQICIRTRCDERNAFIEVADTGSGISPHLLPRIFELFVQSERTLDRSEGGLGVGLAVVKRLLAMHQGDICAKSDGIGQGSTFEIRLPRVARPNAATPEAAPFKADPRRVLIVDDNVDAANSLALLLNLQDHETQVAYNGTDALACVEAFRPEVGLIDIGLPGMNGHELAKRLRAMPQLNGLRLVALTGYGQAEDCERSREAGFDDHLVKPVELSALEQSLAGMAASARGSEHA